MNDIINKLESVSLLILLNKNTQSVSNATNLLIKKVICMIYGMYK